MDSDDVATAVPYNTPGFRFVRRIDGLSHDWDFIDGEYRRVDGRSWCRKLTGYGWVVVTDGVVTARPFDGSGNGDRPPSGLWASAKANKAYAYDLVWNTTPDI